MIDTDKYEGHEEGHQAWQELVKDAPLLLAEVKRLQKYEKAWNRMVSCTVKPPHNDGVWDEIDDRDAEWLKDFMESALND